MTDSVFTSYPFKIVFEKKQFKIVSITKRADWSKMKVQSWSLSLMCLKLAFQKGEQNEHKCL